MRDERMAQSEALYGFLTPTPEYFQQPAQERKSKFFLKNLLKSFPTFGAVNRDTEEELLFAGDDGMKEDRTKDSIAEALYRLINEIYELHGMFKWLRKSFISFVEVTFGRSINRQLRETVYWIFSESMVIYYIRTFKDSMWPNGKLAQPLPVRSPEEKLRTRIRAKEKFLQNQPDAVKSLVGEDNARRGTIKMFEVFQDVRLNKHLFYAIMRDERMAQSEALYGFLTPTPEYFQQPAQERKSKFFLKNLLKSFPTFGAVNRDTEEELLFAGDDGMKEDRTKDSIAEALYRLINEIYELHGMFKWLRKSFISFVEVTFGRSINRQLRETVYWIFSESMVIYYIRTFKDSMWPNGKLAQPLPVRSPEEKLRTRIRAKEKFLQNQPDAVKSLVGEDNARRGTIKMFEVFQDVRLNKHLFYVLLEILLLELCPEMATGIPPAEPSDDLVNIEYNQS